METFLEVPGFLRIVGCCDTLGHLGQNRDVTFSPGFINMEPKNTPVEEENHLNQTTIFRFELLIIGGVHPQKIML